MAALLAGLLAFAELARHSELTAIYAGGMSKVRLALAIVPAFVLIGGFQLLIEDQARPVAMKELRAWGVGDFTSDDAHATWLRRGADILRIEAIDPGQLELHGLTIFQRDAEGNLIAKIDAARAGIPGRLLDPLRRRPLAGCLSDRRQGRAYVVVGRRGAGRSRPSGHQSSRDAAP